ncbi:MAG: AAA family ATPase, partial [Candidatus Paceibacterota bacterium]
MDLTLTNDQSEALSRILEFMHSKVMGQFMLLEGKAGTGKTTLMKMVVRYNNKMGSSRLRILAAAMTHKARKVIEKALNEGGVITVPSKTIANLLKKQRLNSYLGHKKFNTGGNSMAEFDFIIIDEASMLNDIDLEKLIEAAR